MLCYSNDAARCDSSVIPKQPNVFRMKKLAVKQPQEPRNCIHFGSQFDKHVRYFQIMNYYHVKRRQSYCFQLSIVKHSTLRNNEMLKLNRLLSFSFENGNAAKLCVCSDLSMVLNLNFNS